MGRRRRRSYSPRRHERKIEHRQWFTNSGVNQETISLANGLGTNNLVKVSVDALKGDDQTILRTRGYVIVDTTTFASSAVAVLGGIVLPNKTAQQASNTELPNPLVDADTTDWFVWQPFQIPATVADTGSESAPEASAFSVNMQIDSKAKRIMEASESVVWIVGFNASSAESNKDIAMSYCLRTLVGY